MSNEFLDTYMPASQQHRRQVKITKYYIHHTSSAIMEISAELLLGIGARPAI
ncbi:hypothetical protein FH972_006422 [Carpinus fangiana]|uniref:Uncharacterized protein n=1 Tax=Carpinus fangiana TaxID=176857 RepID=A0A5N6QV69_9ROSI|nr:hypothetical protein FH972_006422 [Carpinus fangiana]